LRKNLLKLSQNLTLNVNNFQMRSFQTESKITCDSIKRVLDTKHIECTICNKIISKTNWPKHVKTQIHSSGTKASKNHVFHELTSKPQNSVSTNKKFL
jgi:hypothetical protein